MSDKYDDTETGGYSYLEKLAMTAKGLLDPKEIGMASADEAIFEITGGKPPSPFLGDWVTFEASVVPLAVRSKWARQDIKVIPTNPAEWEAEWREAHKHEFLVRGLLKSGSVGTQIEQTSTDPILGFAEMLRRAADMLISRYEQIKNESPEKPFKTREDLAAEARAQSVG